MSQQSYRSLIYVAVVLAAALFPTVLRFIQTLLAVLQTPLSPLIIKPSEDVSEPGEPYVFAIAALSTLGFHERCFTREILYDDERNTVWYFLHANQTVIASLSSRPSMLTSCPVAFYSFDEEGNSLVTFNRAGAYFGRTVQPKVLAVDGAYTSIEDHWQAHLARLNHTPCPVVDPGEALRRIAERIEGQFEWLRTTGEIHLVGNRWFYTFPVALRLTLLGLKLAKSWRLPYTGPNPQSAQETSRRNLEMFEILRTARGRRSPRSDIKLVLFSTTLAVAFIGWGFFFNWTMAAALVAVLLFHECGHAIAMHAFGHKDISLFFVPFMGAVVTGTPRDMSAFRQAIILFAGPVPGLVLGVLALFYTVSLAATPSEIIEKIALLAIVINLFNLLPITPLDGGQLLELAIFGRWPRARLIFYFLSILVFAGLALCVEAPSLWALATLLSLGLISQFRASRLIAHWKPGLAEHEQIRNLFEAAKRLGIPAFMRSYALIVSVMARKTVRSAKAWEAALIVLILTGVWVTTSAIAFGPQISARTENSAFFSDSRTAQQRDFDTKYRALEDGDDAGDDDLRALDQIAASIPETDPRQIDLQLEHAERLPYHQRFDRFVSILSERRDGLENSRAIIAQMALGDLSSDVQDDTDDNQEVELQNGIDRVMEVLPGAFPQTVWTRLEIIELVDHRLGMNEAERRLNQLRQEAGSREDCHCHVSEIAEAQAWFYLTHGRPADALASLQPSSPGEALSQPGIQRVRAWALLQSGQPAEGRDVMLGATYIPAARPKFLDALRLNFKTRHAYYRSPVDLAYAYHVNNEDAKAKELLASNARGECQSEDSSLEDPAPWQELRVRKLQELLGQLCGNPRIK